MVSFSSQTSRNHFVLYKGQYKSNAFNFFLRNYYYKYNEIDMYQGYSFINLRLFLHKASIIISTLFPPLFETLLCYAGPVKLLKHQTSSHTLFFSFSLVYSVSSVL